MGNGQLKINDVFRDQPAMIQFGLAIDPFLKGKKVDKTMTGLINDFMKRLALRLNPKFFHLMIDLMSSNDQLEKTVGVSVLNLALSWAAEHINNAKIFFAEFIESYLTAPEDLTLNRHFVYAKVICLFHGVGLQSERSPHPSLVSLYSEAYHRNDQTARKLLERLRYIANDHYIFLMPEVTGEDPSGQSLQLAGFELATWKCLDPVIVKGVFTSILADLDQAADLADETTAQITRIEYEQQKIEDRLVEMWSKISCEPNYDVLDLGGDSFEITGWLKRSGIERLSFLREGYRFPDVGIRLVQRVFDQTCTFRYPLSPPISNIDQSADQSERKLMGLPLFIVATHCYHQIICAQPRPAQSSSRKIQRPTPVENRSVQVRAHFRRLLPGWQPSPEQVQAALLRLGYIKDGYTFVLPHRRGAPTNQLKLSPTQAVQSAPQISFEQIIEEFL